VTDAKRLVVLPAGEPSAVAAYAELADRVSKQDAVAVQTADRPARDEWGKASVLLLGGPTDGAAFEWAGRGLPPGAELRPDGFRVGGREYRGGGMALLLSFRNPDNPDHVVSVFYGLSPEAVRPVARLLFFYGWNSHVVFENGKVVARGDEQ
jgi:aminopeptidase N